MNRTALVAIHLLASLVCAQAVADSTSDTILDRYFEAIGGRAIWAEGHGEYVLAKIADSRFALPGTFEICWNWELPQTADRLRVQGLSQTRVYAGSHGWTVRKSSGAPGTDHIEWDGARMMQGLAEWTGNFEVLTHRIANGDERVTTRMGEGSRQGWIEILVDQDVVGHLLIDSDGEPKKFHRVFDDVSVDLGPLADRGGIRFPAWGAFEGGEPFDLLVFEILDATPVQPFHALAANVSAYMHCE